MLPTACWLSNGHVILAYYPKMAHYYFIGNTEILTPDLLLDERIKFDQVNIIAGCIGATVCATIFYFYSIQNNDNHPYLNAWLIAHFLLFFIWIFFIYFYKNYFPQWRKYWATTSMSTGSLYGLLWGSSWILFVDINNHQQFGIWAFMLFMVVAGGIYSIVFHLPSVILFLSCLLFPILLNLAINENTENHWFLYLIIITIIASYAFSIIINRFIFDALSKREENVLLARQLAKEKQQVEKVSQEKTRFLAAASHDLRQPIQAIRLFEHILSSRLTNKENKALLKKLHDSTDSLASLLDSLLDISKLDAGVVDIEKSVFCIDDVLSRIYQQYKPIAKEENIELVYVYSSVYVESDSSQLERIIRNLVVNAIKHMGQGKIILGFRRSNSAVIVLDNGVGIRKEEQAKIFQEFYQLNNPERNRSKGLGLGLAIVNRTANLIGHSINLISEEGKGCRFSIQVSKIIPNFGRQEIVPTDEISISSKKLSLSILVIEDDQEVLQGLNDLLSSWGHRTFLASNKKDALRLGKENPIELVISDYQLQNDDNGIDVIISLRKYYQAEIPAILLTGNTNPITLKEISRYGVPILNKPFSASLLEKELDNFV